MTTQLFGVQAWDPVMLAVATLLLTLAALMASYSRLARGGR